MAGRDVKNGPLWEIWALAAGAALVAFGVAYVVGKLEFAGAAFIGGGLAAVIVLAFGFPRDRGAVSRKREAGKSVAPVAEAPVAAAVAAPVMAAAAVASPAGQSRPAALDAARDGRADDLKIVKGIGPKLEQLCHTLGFYHFDQVAAWTPAEIAWVDDNLEGFKGRVTRDRWVPQAKAIVEMGPEAFLKALDDGREF